MSNVRGQTGEGEQLARELAPPEKLKLIITGETPEAIQTLIEVAEKIGQYLVEKSVTTSQIRNIFGTARMIEQEVKTLEDDKPLPIRVQRNLQMLRPKLAYQYGRIQKHNEKEGMGALTGILSEAIALVGSDVRRFRNFMDFFEAILAYHRRYGGTN
jgi:CRISPR-associated protein Csm2